MDVYWAADEEQQIAKNIIEKWTDYRKYIYETGELDRLRKSYNIYFGDTKIKEIAQGIKAIHVNNYASLIRNLHVMVTSQRPAWQPRAINSDLASQASADLAEGLLDYYMREKGIEKKLNEATLLALYLKEGWICLDWDVNAGEPIAVDNETGDTVFQGDVSISTHTMLDVCRDVFVKELGAHKWFIVRKFKNKYDLAAEYPDKADEILKIKTDLNRYYEYELRNDYLFNKEKVSDLIPVYVLYHDKTQAVKEGRLSILAGDDCLLFDGPLPYKRPYVYPVTTGTKVDTPFGHSNMFDLLPLQDALNANFSAIISNQSANAVQNFQVPKGSGVNVTNLDGMRIIEYDPKLGSITPLELLRTAPEVFNFNEVINNYMQLLPSIGSVSRGEAPASMSGAAMALLQQQTLQSSNGLQLSHTILLEQTGTALIELLQDFAEEPRVAYICGKTKKSIMKYFAGKDLMGVSRVIVDSANPLTKTSAGRVEIANQLLQQGMIKNPEQYIAVLTTGTIEPIYEYEKSMQTLIRSENEALMNGEKVQAVITDDHSVHAREHLTVINSLDARQNPIVLQNALAHIQEHVDFSKNIDPAMANLIGIISQPPPPPPQPPPGNATQVMNTQTPLEQQVTDINLPKPAESPLPPQA